MDTTGRIFSNFLTAKNDIKQFWNKIRKDPRTDKVHKILQRLIVLAILALIIYQLVDIGWKEVLRSLPTHPLFYLLFVFLYLNLPVSEIFIYGRVWQFRKLDGFRAFLKKHVYNNEVMGYSGEFYLFLWGRKQVEGPDKKIFKNIRDNTIISSVTSNLVAVLLLAGLVYTGTIDISGIMDDVNLLYAAMGLMIAVIVAVVLYQLRRYIFDLPRQKALAIFGIYLTRFLLHHGAMMLMWAVALPGTSLSVWLTFIAIFIVVNRIPFVPSKDLVFMWAGIEYARVLDETMLASVAGMLLVYSALKKITGLVLYLYLSATQDESDSETVSDNEG